MVSLAAKRRVVGHLTQKGLPGAFAASWSGCPGMRVARYGLSGVQNCGSGS